VSAVVRRRVRVRVRGRVQGVWFRESARLEALRLGLAGQVRNLPDGSVEAIAEGAPGAVEDFVAWCGVGPPSARVDALSSVDEPAEGLAGFEVVR
jgi:acylphosphatase